MHDRAEKILKILDDARRSRTSFHIVFQHGHDRKIFEIHEDCITYLDSTDLKEKFSVLLVMLKIMTSDELKQKTQIKLKAFELDEELIQEKQLTEHQIRKVFSLQLSRMVQAMLEWDRIDFKINEREKSKGPSKKPPLHLEEMQLHLLRTMNLSTERLVEYFEGYHVNLVLDKIQVMRALPFNSAESTVLSKLTGMFGIPEVLQQVNAPQEKTLEHLALLDALHFLSFTPLHRVPSASPFSAPEKAEAPPAQPAPSAPSPAKAGAISGGAAGTEKAFDVQGKISELSDLHDEMDRQNYYDVLGIDREKFSLSELKNRYYALVKLYHPDKFEKYRSPQLSSLLEKISNLINTAYETLKDPSQKGVYDEKLNTRKVVASGPEPPLNVDALALEHFNKGRALINSQKYAEAVGLLRRAVQLKPENGDYNAYLGYAMSKIPQYKREAEQHFLKAIEVNPMNVSTYLHLGRMYKEANLNVKAVNMFEQALQWDPENKIARQELKEIEDSNKSKSRGMFGKLFKR
ncbi:MAG: DnaJ domain-containing protein [Acidobacteria bacterium]|nr:DnaJ domain-containing protein [Acidobacteriota bacterium]